MPAQSARGSGPAGPESRPDNTALCPSRSRRTRAPHAHRWLGPEGNLEATAGGTLSLRGLRGRVGLPVVPLGLRLCWALPPFAVHAAQLRRFPHRRGRVLGRRGRVLCCRGRVLRQRGRPPRVARAASVTVLPPVLAARERGAACGGAPPGLAERAQPLLRLAARVREELGDGLDALLARVGGGVGVPGSTPEGTKPPCEREGSRGSSRSGSAPARTPCVRRDTNGRSTTGESTP